MADDMTTRTTGVPEGEAADTTEEECDALEVVAMHATTTAIGSVNAEEFDATQCMIATATVDGDAAVGASLVGVLSAGSASVHQGAAAVVIVDGETSIEQGGAQVLVAREVDMDRSGAGIVVTGEASLARSWVGVMAARNATLSDDSRVVIDTRSALIIGGLLFGGLGLVAICMLLAGRRIASRIPHMPWSGHPHRGLVGHARGREHGHGQLAETIRARMREMSEAARMPDLPKIDLSAIADTIARLRHAG